MNPRFNEPWTEDMFALGFDKPIELRRGLPRTGVGFCEPVILINVEVGFDEPCVCSTCVVLHTCHSWSGMYSSHSFVLLHTYHSQSGTY